jgi:hypothetical protein
VTYTVKVGGLHILEDNKPWAEGSVVATYYDLNYKHVQALWDVFGDPQVTQAYMNFVQAFAQKAQEAGSRYAVAKGKMSQEDLSDLRTLGG